MVQPPYSINGRIGPEKWKDLPEVRLWNRTSSYPTILRKYWFLNVEVFIGSYIYRNTIFVIIHSLEHLIISACVITTYLRELKRHLPYLMAKCHHYFTGVARDLLSRRVLELKLIFYSVCVFEKYLRMWFGTKGLLFTCQTCLP